jgi:hypothetical protein
MGQLKGAAGFARKMRVNRRRFIAAGTRIKQPAR